MIEARRDDTAGVSDPHYVTLLGLCNDLLRRRWAVVAIVAGCAVGSAFVRLAQPRTYTAVASFVPDAVQSLRGGGDVVPALAVLGGVGSARGALDEMGTRGAGIPSALPPSAPPVKPLDPEFYWQLLRTRELLLAVSAGPFTISTPSGVRTGTAADFYELPPGPAPQRTEDAARRVTREMTVLYSEKSGVLTLRVRALDPNFARLLTERLIDALREQHRRMADSRGAAQVAFLARTAADARREMTVAESELARFLSDNRAFSTASPLALEFRRRDADVLEKRRQYADLAVQLERARLDQSRVMPTISVVQRPETPPKPDPRGVLSGAIIGAAGGVAVALLLVLIREHLSRLRAAGDRELSALEAEWRATRRRRRARDGRLAGPTIGTGPIPGGAAE